MRKILITNDDGITADGIIRLAKAAVRYGKVYVIAPKSQCSAMSHKITLRETIDVGRVDFPVDGIEAYATTGTPADCIRFGILNIIKEKPDVVLAGINFGYNSGTDIQYSATVGAAMEAASTGVHAIALSEGTDGNHVVTDKYINQIIDNLIDRRLDYNQIWNVNFPECSLNDFKGILENRVVAHNSFYNDRYMEEILEDGTIRLTIDGQFQDKAAEGTDFRAILDNYISISVVNNLR